MGFLGDKNIMQTEFFNSDRTLNTIDFRSHNFLKVTETATSFTELKTKQKSHLFKFSKSENVHFYSILC